MRIDEAALQVMAERQAKRVWYGDPELVADIYERARGSLKGVHPLNRSAAVMRALAMSARFKRAGKINHLGTWYSVYEIKPPHRWPGVDIDAVHTRSSGDHGG